MARTDIKHERAKGNAPGTWWDGEAQAIEPDTRIHVGDQDVRDACHEGGDIPMDNCPGMGVESFEDVEVAAKHGDEEAKGFITEMFFRCWWHEPENVAEEFAHKGWTLDGEPIDMGTVADLCYEFQMAGYGYAGFK